jgi:hypothetical protein
MDHRHRNPSDCSDEDTCTVLSCEVCLKEIPADAIKVTDTQDYVHYFCGLDCLQIWQKQSGNQQAAKPAGRSDRLK